MNVIETFKKNIDEAEMLLIGIGEEFFLGHDGFEESYKAMLFDERILQLQLEPLFKEIMLKRWLKKHVDEKVMNAYSCISVLCRDKNYYVVSLGIDDYIYELNSLLQLT